MSIIDVGPVAADRGSALSATNKTIICMDNPSNLAGTITSVEVWVQTTVTNMTVGIFSGAGGAGAYTPRSSVAIGQVVAGSKKSFSGLSLAIEVGDYIGCWTSNGKHEVDGSGFSGCVEYSGDGTGGVQNYTLLGGDAISLKGFGTSTDAGWISFTGKEDDSWNNAENIYDGSSVTSGQESWNGQSVTLTVASTLCDKLRINAGLVAGGQTNLKVEVYYGAAFHEIHSGLLTEDTVQELAIGSTEYVTKARLTTNTGINSEVWELELYDTVASGGSPTPMVLGAGGFKAKRNIIIGEI